MASYTFNSSKDLVSGIYTINAGGLAESRSLYSDDNLLPRPSGAHKYERAMGAQELDEAIFRFKGYRVANGPQLPYNEPERKGKESDLSKIPPMTIEQFRKHYSITD